MDQEKLQEKLLTAADSAKDASELIKLLRQGADVHCTDSFGLTPLMRAALFNSSAKVVRDLMVLTQMMPPLLGVMLNNKI